MTTVTRHAPGTFCWPELSTTDPQAAGEFYSGLFGWAINDVPMPPEHGGTYTIFRHADRDCAACSSLSPEMAGQGVPPHWGAYVAVANADDAAKRATELGGTLVAGPFDVMDIGRMAVLQDPTGAAFCVWQAVKHIGVGVLDEPGALCWSELMSRDPAKSGAFYRDLLGWSSQDLPMMGGTYTVFARPGGANAAGMMAIPSDLKDVPSHWLSYFQVASAKESIAKAQALGGRVMVPPTQVPGVGTFSVLQDPQGAVFAVLQAASS